jgi:hypothetical protein
MEAPKLITTAGNLWFYHPIGMGLVMTFDSKAFKLTVSCCNTGRPISVAKREYKTIEEFEEAVKEVHLLMIEDGVNSRDLDFYEDTTYIGDSMIEVDLKLMQN